MTNRAIGTICAAVAAVTLTACGGEPWDGTALDEPGWTACDQLGAEIQAVGGGDNAAVLPPSRRGPLVEAAQPGGTSDTPVAGAVSRLVAVSDDPGPAWTVALTEVSRTCLDAGY